MDGGMGMVPGTVSEYVAAVEGLGSGQFTSRFTESSRKFFASLYGAPFFAVDRFSPDLGNSSIVNMFIADPSGSLAADGGRWLSLYSKAQKGSRKFTCTVCVPTKPQPTKAPKPLLFQLPQQILIKSWSRQLQNLDKFPDALILYVPDGFDAIYSLVEELSQLEPEQKCLLASHSELEALIVRSLLDTMGFKTSEILGFDKAEGEPQQFAAGAWWFSVITPQPDNIKQLVDETISRIRTAYQSFRKFVRLGKSREEVERIASIYARRTTETIDKQENVNAIRVTPHSGIDLASGRFFTQRSASSDADSGFVWDDKTLGIDLVQTAPQGDDRLELALWVAKALSEDSQREANQVARAPLAEEAPSQAPVTPDILATDEPVATASTIARNEEPAKELRKPRAQRLRLSRSAGTVNVLALAARLGKDGDEPARIFERARSKILDWLRGKGFVVSSPTTNSHIELPDGEAIIETDGQSIWALRIDDRRSMSAGAIWRVEATLLGTGAPAISVRLAQVRSTEDAPPPVASGVPSLVANIAEEIGMQDAGEPLLNSVIELEGDRAFAWLARLLLNPNRSQPVIVVSSTGKANADPSIARLATRLAGVAHVVTIDSALSSHMIREFGRERSVYGNAVRLYRPGFTVDATDQYQHPVWTLKGGQLPIWAANDIFEQSCAISLEVGDLEERAPSFQMVRNYLAEQRLASSEQRLVALRQQLDDIAESKEEQIGRLQAIRSELEAALGEYKTKNRELFDQAATLHSELKTTRQERDTALEESRQLRYQLDNRWADDDTPETQLTNESYYPNTWDDLEDWVDIYGENKLILHPAATKAARKSNFKDIPLAYKAMEYLVRYYIPMRTRDKDDTEAYTRSQTALAELGLEESDVGTAQDIRRYRQEYRRLYEGKEVTLDRHIKDGVGFGGEFQFRLYFYYDEASAKVLIGHLPTHLTNRLSHNG